MIAQRVCSWLEFCMDSDAEMHPGGPEAASDDKADNHIGSDDDDEDALDEASPLHRRLLDRAKGAFVGHSDSGRSSAADVMMGNHSFAFHPAATAAKACPTASVSTSGLPTGPADPFEGAGHYPAAGQSTSSGLGTSAPVDIPHFMRRCAAAAAADGGDEDEETAGWEAYLRSSTFVPPHQLSQRSSELFSLKGQSPGSAFSQRQHLRARDAILKSTGFLEGNGMPVVTRVATGSVEPSPRLAYHNRNGGLSQALLCGGGP